MLGLVGASAFGWLYGATAHSSSSPDPSVVCFNKPPSPGGTFARPVLTVRPNKCFFVERHRKPIDANGRDMSHIHWGSWGRHEARGKGKVFVSTVGPTPARVHLSRPRPGCHGGSVFTKAKFVVKGYGKTHLRLDACT